MEEKQITEKESLLIIQQMIDRARNSIVNKQQMIDRARNSIVNKQQMIGQARNSIVDKGTWPIYWGAIITFCSLVLFVEIRLQKFLPFDIFLLTIPAFLLQLGIVFYQKTRKKENPRPAGLSLSAITYVWAAFAVSIFLVVFARGGATPIVYFVLYGIPTFVTGGIIHFKPMTIGGIVCWLCALATILFPINNSTYALLAAVCAISAWLIPGIILRRRYLRMAKTDNV